MPTLDGYRRMLDVFKSMGRKMVQGVSRGRYELLGEELQMVVRAWFHHRWRRMVGWEVVVGS